MPKDSDSVRTGKLMADVQWRTDLTEAEKTRFRSVFEMMDKRTNGIGQTKIKRMDTKTVVEKVLPTISFSIKVAIVGSWLAFGVASIFFGLHHYRGSALIGMCVFFLDRLQAGLHAAAKNIVDQHNRSVIERNNKYNKNANR